MKRILFYLLIVAQIIVILFLTYQFEQIDTKGQTIKLETLQPKYSQDTFFGSIYVDYEINQIKTDKWDARESVDYNDRIYTLLKGDEDGIYHVEKASIEKLTATSDNEIVIAGTYQHEDEELDYYHVNFGMEEIKHVEQFGPIPKKKKLVITIQIGKWGQHKVTSVNEAN